MAGKDEKFTAITRGLTTMPACLLKEAASLFCPILAIHSMKHALDGPDAPSTASLHLSGSIP